MKNLRLKYKFILIILLAALPAVIATYLLAEKTSESIRVAAKEVTGSNYLRPLNELHKLVDEHRVASMSSLVDKNTYRTDVKSRLSNSINSMNSAHAELNPTLNLNDAWDKTRAELESLIGTDTNLDYESAKNLHDKTIETLNTLTRIVGEKSTLILDPELDSYYLMDAVILKIPPAITALSSYKVEFTERSGFMFQVDNLYTLEKIKIAATRASEAVNVAISHNAESARILNKVGTDFQQSYTTALESLERVRVNSTDDKIQKAFSDTKYAITKGYELVDAANAELERILQVRIKTDQTERNITVAAVLATILIAMIFTYIVGRSISSTIIRAKTLAEAIADDQLENTINAQGRDEPGQLMNALAVMQEKLNTRINEERQLSIANGRIKQALECVSSPVLVADVNKKINYSNITANDFFKRYQSEIARDIQGFSHENILGQPMDFLNKGKPISSTSNSDVSANELEG